MSYKPYRRRSKHRRQNFIGRGTKRMVYLAKTEFLGGISSTPLWTIIKRKLKPRQTKMKREGMMSIDIPTRDLSATS